MELLPSLSEWMSQFFSDLPDSQKTSKQEDYVSAAPGQSIISSILSAVDNTKRIVKRNVTDLFTDTENALTKTGDELLNTVLDKKQMQDPAQWLSGGSGKIASAFVGAFRPAESKLLPSTLVELKNKINDLDFKGKGVPLSDKLSDKELAKYGSPEFLLDKYLPSTEQGGNPSWLNAEELPLSQFLEEYDVSRLRQNAEYMAKTVDFKNKSEFGDAQFRIKERLQITPHLESDIRAFRDQIIDKKPIYISDSLHSSGSAGDIRTALKTVDSLVSKSSHTPEQLSKKSLKQLLGIADEETKKIQAGIEAITDFTKQRTAQLKATQGLKNDLVELTDKNDFGAETEFLKHCVGAGSINAKGEFLPKWHPITGADLTADKNLRNSAEIYWGLKERGSARYFSYRPEGLPVATVELTKEGAIKQLYGFKNTEVPEDVRLKIEEGLKPIIREMKYGPPGNRKFSRVNEDMAPNADINLDIYRLLIGDGQGLAERAGDLARQNEWRRIYLANQI